MLKLTKEQLNALSIELHQGIIFDAKNLEEAETLVADAEKVFGREQCEKMDVYENLKFRKRSEEIHNEFEKLEKEIRKFNINDFSDFEKESEKKQKAFLEEAEKMLSGNQLVITINW